MAIIISIIIIILPNSRVHQMSWTGVFLVPFEDLGISEVFRRMYAVPSSTTFGVDLVRSCQALKLYMFYKISGYCSQGSDHHRHYCCFLFPKPFFFDFQIKVLSDLFHFFLIDSAISWYCHINQSHLLLFNHCYI